jgi:hypothetical protein
MAKNKGHENLIPCKKGESGNPNGRPKKLVSKVLDELKEEGEQVSKSQVFDIYQIMISLTIPKLKEVAGDESKPALYRILAKEILGKKGFEAIEKMLDRANGKPMITQEIKQENTGDTIKVVFESTGVKLPQSENDFIDD